LKGAMRHFEAARTAAELNLRCFTGVLIACRTVNDPERALLSFDILRRSNIRPDEVYINLLREILTSNKRHDLVKKLEVVLETAPLHGKANNKSITSTSTSSSSSSSVSATTSAADASPSSPSPSSGFASGKDTGKSERRDAHEEPSEMADEEDYEDQMEEEDNRSAASHHQPRSRHHQQQHRHPTSRGDHKAPSTSSSAPAYVNKHEMRPSTVLPNQTSPSIILPNSGPDASKSHFFASQRIQKMKSDSNGDSSL